MKTMIIKISKLIAVDDQSPDCCSKACQYLQQFSDCEFCDLFKQDLDSKTGLRCNVCLAYGIGE